MFENRASAGISTRDRMIGLACDAGVALTFASVLIGAGHGVGPIGLLLFGDVEAWGVPMAAGWAGLAALVAAALAPPRVLYGLLVSGGLGLLFLSWGLFVAESASVFASVVYFSIPFLAAAAGRLIYLAVQVRRAALVV